MLPLSFSAPPFPIRLRLAVQSLPNRRTCSYRTPCAKREPVLEGDLLAYRPLVAPSTEPSSWSVGAVTHIADDIVELNAVHARSVDDHGRWELFVESQESFSSNGIPLSQLDFIFVDADYETRVIEDRIHNPHGEESEYCWRVRPQQLVDLNIMLDPPPS